MKEGERGVALLVVESIVNLIFLHQVNEEPRHNNDGVVVMANHRGVHYQYHIHHSGWIVFWINSVEDYDRVLQGDLYFTYGSPLFLKIISRCFLYTEGELRFLTAWI